LTWLGSWFVMLDLKLLTTFREVALRRSFSDAATVLGYTQPAVSQHVARLEAVVGVRLLDRDARGVHPTPAGELLLTRAAALLDAARRAEEDVREAAGAGRPTVRIGAFATLAAGLLPGATRDLRARRPDLRMEVKVIEPEDAIDAMLSDRLDLATIIDSELSPMGVRPGVEHVHLCEDPLLLVMASDHPMANRASVGLEELAGEGWLMPDVGGTCPDSNIVLRACRDAGAAGDGGRRGRRRADPEPRHGEHPHRRRDHPAARPAAGPPHPGRRTRRRGRPPRRPRHRSTARRSSRAADRPRARGRRLGLRGCPRLFGDERRDRGTVDVVLELEIISLERPAKRVLDAQAGRLECGVAGRQALVEAQSQVRR
jgi:DNA-binding transcriptional LysR family regulator